MSNFLTKDEFWQTASDLPTEDAPLCDARGNLKGYIRMRGLTGDELTTYQEGMTVQKNGQQKVNAKHAMAKLIVLSAINATDDNPTDTSPYFVKSDVLKLSQMAAKAIMPMFEVAQKLSGLSDDDMKELTEGFTEARNESFGSD